MDGSASTASHRTDVEAAPATSGFVYPAFTRGYRPLNVGAVSQGRAYRTAGPAGAVPEGGGAMSSVHQVAPNALDGALPAGAEPTFEVGHAAVVSAHAHHEQRSRAGRVGRFLRHLLEMVLAMMVGMALFGGARALLDPTGFADVLRQHLDARYLAMTGFMAVPMVLLMRYRGHGWARTAEMVGAMAAPVAAACLLWRFGLGAAVPALSDQALGTSSHLAMYAGMLLAMLYRFGDYAHAGPHLGRGHAVSADGAGAGGA
jgi:flagellar biosynthetic protein FliP